MDPKGSVVGWRKWQSEVDHLLKRDWCIDTVDAGLSDEDLKRYWQQGQTPTEFVEWFAEKYDLIPANDSGYLPRRLGVTASPSGRRAER